MTSLFTIKHWDLFVIFALNQTSASHSYRHLKCFWAGPAGTCRVRKSQFYPIILETGGRTWSTSCQGSLVDIAILEEISESAMEVGSWACQPRACSSKQTLEGGPCTKWWVSIARWSPFCIWKLESQPRGPLCLFRPGPSPHLAYDSAWVSVDFEFRSEPWAECTEKICLAPLTVNEVG